MLGKAVSFIVHYLRPYSCRRGVFLSSHQSIAVGLCHCFSYTLCSHREAFLNEDFTECKTLQKMLVLCLSEVRAAMGGMKVCGTQARAGTRNKFACHISTFDGE